jgi:aspartate kinase
MSTLVMKFGGASVATPEQFAQIAEIILLRSTMYKQIVVVVSAMGNTTNELIALAKKVNSNPPRRELDMLISVGERISISLLAMALALKQKEAISFTGSQSGIITCSEHTDARIIDIRPQRLKSSLDEGKIVIVAGFQGVSKKGEITTLGRGGSDTSAVALGIALGADKVEFFKDVPGICLEDPKVHPESEVLANLSYSQALDIVNKGAKVLHPRCVALAAKNRIPLHVLSFHDPLLINSQGTVIAEGERIQENFIYEEEEGKLIHA